MTEFKFDDCGTQERKFEGIDPAREAPAVSARSAARRTLVLGLAAALIGITVHAAVAAGPAPVKIAVFDFELDDKSAAGGVIAKDAIDIENLKQSAEMARSMLADSGRYSVVDTGGVVDDVAAAGGVQHCNGCDARLARGLGADQSLVGVITRVSRMEYTLQMVIRDAGTGAVVSSDFTGLRMGANYSWPRGAKWLMTNRVLCAQPAN